MLVIRRFIAVWSILVLLAFTASDLWSQASGLAARVPNDANAIVIFNVDKVLASPIAQREKWKEQRGNAAAAGLTVLPPSASHFIMSSKLDLEYMQPIWEVALAKLKDEPSMPKVAAKWGGKMDRVEGRTAVLLPDDTYVVQLGPGNVAVRRPANRQSVARWLRQSNNASARNLSPYMQKALAYSDKLGTPIVMAMDLEGVISANTLQDRLTNMKSLEGKDVDVAKIAQTLESMQGITLGLNVKDDVSGAMVIDFAGDTSPLKDIAKPLLLEILADRSAMIDEFADWKAVVEPKRVRVIGRLKESGFRRVMSILDAPAALQESMPSLSDESDPQITAKLASQQCFKSVTGLVEDLQERPGKKTLGQVGTWCGRYADKIDKLPMLNVDPELLDYRSYVSSALREASSVLRGVGGESRVRELNAPAQYRTVGRWGSMGAYYGGGYATFEDSRAEAQDRTRIRTEERTSGASSAREIMTEISKATEETRRKMTEKYQAEF